MILIATDDVIIALCL